jgi:uncharacterized protein YeaO (DUF488 family)
MSNSTNTMRVIKIKRVYEKAAKDEYRILVDRLWPRGLTKERAAIDLWLKEIAPSSELRKWFAHNPERFLEFSARYGEELAQNPAVAIVSDLLTKHEHVVLVYAAKSEDINHAVVLKGFMESM